MKKNITYIKTILLLVVVLVVFGFTSNRNSTRKIDEINVFFSKDDNLFLTQESVNNLLIQNGKHIKSQLKSLINLQGLELAVQEHPMISKSEVSLDVLGDVQVEVKQRKPLARIFKAASSVYLDAEGKEMPLSKYYSARVVLVDNKKGNIKNDEVFPLIQEINENKFLQKTIVMIHKDTKGFWVQTRLNKQKVLLGTLDRLDQKLKKLQVFYNYAVSDSVVKTFATINLQYKGQVICTK